MKSVLVIGMGRFGRHLAGRMLDLGNDVMIVDSNEKLIEELSIRFGNIIYSLSFCVNYIFIFIY